MNCLGYYRRKRRHRVDYDDGMSGWTSQRRATGCSCKWMTEHGRWFECLYILTTPISNTSIYNFVITPSFPYSQYVMYVNKSQLNDQRKQQEQLQRNQFKQQALRDDLPGDIMFISTISGKLRSGCISILSVDIDKSFRYFKCNFRHYYG